MKKMTAAFGLSLAALLCGGCSNSGPKESVRQEQPVVKGITLAEVAGTAFLRHWKLWARSGREPARYSHPVSPARSAC